MIQTTIAPSLQAEIQGDVTGMVAAGNTVVQIGAIYGGVVTINTQGQPAIRRRSENNEKLPRVVAGFVDRQSEVQLAQSILQRGQPIEFHGQPGIGKTALLQYVARHGARLKDGIAYYSIANIQVEDLLQQIFDFYYTTDINYKPRPGEVKYYLQSIQALLILDDVHFSREQLQQVMNELPSSAFLIASEEQRLWGSGQSVPMSGLPADDAVYLVSRQLGRSLLDGEQAAAKELCMALEGHPLRILQTTAVLINEGLDLVEYCRRVQTATKPTAIVYPEILKPSSTSDKGQRILAALASIGQNRLHKDHLAAIIDVEDLPSLLNLLEGRHVIQSYGSKYSLAENLAENSGDIWDLTSWRAWFIHHFIKWGQQNKNQPELIFRDADPILYVLAWAVKEKRWQNVIDLVQILEGPLALGRRWHAWQQVLHWAWAASRILGLVGIEAWTLHQLGTRDLLLGNNELARNALQKALQLRLVLGDDIGASISQHNLSLINVPPLPPPSEQPPSPIGGSGESGLATLAKIAIGLIMLSIVGVSLVLLGVFLFPEDGPMTPEVEEVVQIMPGTITSKPSNMPTMTSSPTPTKTPTDTPTITLPPPQTETPTGTPTMTSSPTPTKTPTGTPTMTSSPTPTKTPTGTPTMTPSMTPSITPTFTPEILIDFINEADTAEWISSNDIGTLTSIPYTEPQKLDHRLRWIKL